MTYSFSQYRKVKGQGMEKTLQKIIRLEFQNRRIRKQRVTITKVKELCVLTEKVKFNVKVTNLHEKTPSVLHYLVRTTDGLTIGEKEG